MKNVKKLLYNKDTENLQFSNSISTLIDVPLVSTQGGASQFVTVSSFIGEFDPVKQKSFFIKLGIL